MSTLPFFLYYFLHQWSLTDIYSTFLSLLFATKSMTSSVFLRSLLPVRGEHVTVMALCAHSLVLKYRHRTTPCSADYSVRIRLGRQKYRITSKN